MGVMGQSAKGSMDSPYEMDATESEDGDERDNKTCRNEHFKQIFFEAFSVFRYYTQVPSE